MASRARANRAAYGWSEQRPIDWWNGVIRATRGVLAAVEARPRIAAVCACGQMHGTVLIDDGTAGERYRSAVERQADRGPGRRVRACARVRVSAESGNPPTPAWPGFKLAWLSDNDPVAYAQPARS